MDTVQERADTDMQQVEVSFKVKPKITSHVGLEVRIQMTPEEIRIIYCVMVVQLRICVRAKELFGDEPELTSSKIDHCQST